ncbi:HipA domain-containing protein [uncultured Stenotrophomonas sp.]|uniref:HipA domain-containing protein n=1 Tax=uncultured Stenotrophomonas sp. TaxID=165438 RepID=UPI0028E6E069|nr:HipA domain-containing protein [uncultured Stenotrophomonas sp.]
MADAPHNRHFPLFRLKEDATVERLGHLESLPGDAFKAHLTSTRPNLARCPDGDTFPGLPWYLEDLRPQGFLGRLHAQRHAHQPGVGLPGDHSPPTTLLKHLALTGGTGVGDLLPGEPALQAALAALECPPDHVQEVDRSRAYPERAQGLTIGRAITSGPGGEQPKFTATVAEDGQRKAVLVKFARAADGAAAERWADLLVCEHLALQCLRDAGVAACSSHLIQSRGYTFLELERFDRTPVVLGRRGFVSLLSLSKAFVRETTHDWGAAGEHLQEMGWITADTALRMEQLHAFGRLIGNNHMHHGNLGFQLHDHGPLPLAPVYDMLPSSLAPCRSGALPALAPIPPVAPVPRGSCDPLLWAAPLAMDYWNRVAASSLLRSKALRAMAKRNAWRAAAIVQASA